MVKREELLHSFDGYTKYVIIRFIEDGLLRRGKVGDASLLSVLMEKYTTSITWVSYNSSVIMVAIEVCAVAYCLLRD